MLCFSTLFLWWHVACELSMSTAIEHHVVNTRNRNCRSCFRFQLNKTDSYLKKNIWEVNNWMMMCIPLVSSPNSHSTVHLIALSIKHRMRRGIIGNGRRGAWERCMEGAWETQGQASEFSIFFVWFVSSGVLLSALLWSWQLPGFCSFSS